FIAGLAQIRTNNFITDVDDKDLKEIGPAGRDHAGLAARDEQKCQKDASGNEHHQVMHREINIRMAYRKELGEFVVEQVMFQDLNEVHLTHLIEERDLNNGKEEVGKS